MLNNKVKKDIRESVRPSNWDLPENYIIDVSYGEGFEFELHGEKYVTKGHYDGKGYRKAELKIMSFIGAWGATHYYGKIEVDVSNISHNTQYAVSGYLGGVKIPNEYTSLSLDLVKEIEDFELKDKDRFENYRKGDMVPGFYNEKDVIELGKKVFKELFKGKWVLQIDSYSGELNEKIYKNK